MLEESLSRCPLPFLLSVALTASSLLFVNGIELLQPLDRQRITLYKLKKIKTTSEFNSPLQSLLKRARLLGELVGFRGAGAFPWAAWSDGFPSGSAVSDCLAQCELAGAVP